MTLFDECIEALGKGTAVLTNQESVEISKTFSSIFPITKWGRIEWDKIDKKIQVDSVNEILKYLHEQDKCIDTEIVILWDEATLPVIKSDLAQIIKVIDDVTSVSFDTWLFSPILKYVVEFYHNGEVTIGIL
jgi:hypothetical protein